MATMVGRDKRLDRRGSAACPPKVLPKYETYFRDVYLRRFLEIVLKTQEATEDTAATIAAQEEGLRKLLDELAERLPSHDDDCTATCACSAYYAALRSKVKDALDHNDPVKYLFNSYDFKAFSSRSEVSLDTFDTLSEDYGSGEGSTSTGIYHEKSFTGRMGSNLSWMSNAEGLESADDARIPISNTDATRPMVKPKSPSVDALRTWLNLSSTPPSRPPPGSPDLRSPSSMHSLQRKRLFGGHPTRDTPGDVKHKPRSLRSMISMGSLRSFDSNRTADTLVEGHKPKSLRSTSSMRTLRRVFSNQTFQSVNSTTTTLLGDP